METTAKLVIKAGLFFFVGIADDTNEFIYSTGTDAALKFNSLEELEEMVAEYKITGYAVGLAE